MPCVNGLRPGDRRARERMTTVSERCGRPRNHRCPDGVQRRQWRSRGCSVRTSVRRPWWRSWQGITAARFRAWPWLMESSGASGGETVAIASLPAPVEPGSPRARLIEPVDWMFFGGPAKFVAEFLRINGLSNRGSRNSADIGDRCRETWNSLAGRTPDHHLCRAARLGG